jgi:hypothetical protein
MKKQIVTPAIIQAAIIVLALAIGMLMFLSLLPGLTSMDISPGPTVQECSAQYIAIRNSSLFPVMLRDWEIEYEALGYAYVLPTRTLLPGEAVQVWSGSGQDDTHNLYAGREKSVWRINGMNVRGNIFHIEYYQAQNCD